MSRKRIAACLLLGSFLWRSACADIYAHTSEDGTVTLTNVPTHAQYTLLVGQAPERTRSPEHEGERAGRPYQQAVDEASKALGLESALLHAVISVESGYNPKALSPKGAAGLMQLMPETAKRYGVADALDPRENLRGGARYLKDLLALFDNDLSLALAAYNAGETAVIRHGRRIPPYGETRRYVPKVLELYQKFRAES